MGDAKSADSSQSNTWSRILLFPLWLVSWPFRALFHTLDTHFFAYLVGRSLRDSNRIYSIKFIWYGDTVYLHPMVWGSLLLYSIVSLPGVGERGSGWVLLAWFLALGVCFFTIMYNFDVIRTFTLGIGLVALLGVAYFSTIEWAYNPLAAVATHIHWLDARVSPGFYVVSCYVFGILIFGEVVFAWLFHRVEIDESYVYEHRFLQGSTREPIFARSMKRETKDLLELLILGAADIEHKTKSGYRRFKNVPFASLWLGTAIDAMLDYRRKGEVDLRRGASDRDDADQTRVTDAFDYDDDDGLDDDAADDADQDL